MELQSNEINELVAALAKAQGKMGNAKQDKTNPFFKSKYADLASIMEACRKVLSEHELAVIQTSCPVDGVNMLITTLAHSSGQWMKALLPINPIKNDPQAMGSAMTYMKRYALAAIVGIATEDDDGERATRSNGNDKKIITEKQANLLYSKLKEDPDYKNELESFFKKRGETLDKMPIEFFNNVLKKIEDRKIDREAKIHEFKEMEG